MVVPVLCLIFVVVSHHVANCANPAEAVSTVLHSKLAKYDKNLRPNYGGGNVSVEVLMDILEVTDISDVNTDFTIVMDLSQTWTDPRLSFNDGEGATVEQFRAGEDLTKSFWIPDTTFHNVRNQNKVLSSSIADTVLLIEASGQITLTRRITATASCEMDLQNFPHDCQACSLEIQSFGHSQEDIQYAWKNSNDSVRSWEKLSTSSFLVLNVTQQRGVSEQMSGKFSRLSLVFDLRRNYGFYLKCIYLPAIICIILTWVSFLLPTQQTNARIFMVVISLLVVVLLEVQSSWMTAQTPYFTALDLYLWWCCATILVSLGLTLLVAYLEQGTSRYSVENKVEVVDGSCQGLKRWIGPNWVDRIGLIVYLAVFLLFNIGYWVHYNQC